MSFPRITVLMPVYNGEKYLHEAIGSILSQTFTDFEFLIIDDGSTDSSLEIVNSYEDTRIRLVQNQTNLGLIVTLNNGLELARGEFIARMDADDISCPRRLEKQLLFMSSRSDVAVCGTAIKLFGKMNSSIHYPKNDQEIRAKMLFECPIAHPSVMLRRKVFIQEGLRYSELFTHAEDYDLWSRIPNKYRLANLNSIFLKHRVHDKQVSREYSMDQLKMSDAIRKRLLEDLGICVSKENLDLHSKIARRKFDSTPKFINQAERWLKYLKEVQLNETIFDRPTFEKVIEKYWWEVCFNSSDLGFDALRKFASSNLFTFLSSTFKYNLIFIVKCIFKYKKNSV